MTAKLYTFGYQGRQVHELIKIALNLDAVVVDVRYSPISRRPEWCGDKLFQAFPKPHDQLIYFRAGPSLGNVNYKQPALPFQLAAEQKGLGILKNILETGVSIILLCYEAEAVSCHRSLIARKMQELIPGLEVVDL